MSTLAPIGVAPAYKYVNQAAFNVCNTYCCRNINAAIAIPLSLLNIALCPLKGVGVFIHEIADLHFCGAIKELVSNIWDGVKSIVLTAVLVVLLAINIFSPVNLYGCLKQKNEIEQAIAIKKLAHEDLVFKEENAHLRLEIEELSVLIKNKNLVLDKYNAYVLREEGIKRDLESERAKLDADTNIMSPQSPDLTSSPSSPVTDMEPTEIERMTSANKCPRKENDILKSTFNELSRDYIAIQIAVDQSFHKIGSLLEVNSKLREANERSKSMRKLIIPPTTPYVPSKPDVSPESPFTFSPVRPSLLSPSRITNQTSSRVSLFSPIRRVNPVAVITGLAESGSHVVNVPVVH